MTDLSLAEFVEITSSKRIKREDYVPDGIPFYRSKEVIERAKGNRISTELFISEEKFSEIEKKFGAPKPGDILLTSVGTLGVSWQVAEDIQFYFKDGNLTWFRNFDSKLDSKYFLYWLRSGVGQQELDRISIGSTQRALTIVALKSLPFSPPPVSDQKAIAQILGTLDDKIELNQKMNQTLEEIAKAIFKSWFVDFDPVRAKAEGRPTGLPSEISDLFPDELVDSEIGEIPNGWKTLSLDKVFTPRNERAGDRQIREFSSTNNGIHPRDTKYKKKLSSSTSKNKVAYKGDFVFGMSRELLNFGLMSKEIGGFSSAYKIYEVSGDYKFSDFIYRQFLYRPQYYYRAVSASSREGQSISQDALLNLRILSPNSSVLSIFNRTVAPLSDRCELLFEENHLLAELRDTLLPKLISGELRIPDAEKFLEEAGI